MRAGGAEKAHKGDCPLAGLGRDRVFWFCVVTRFSMPQHGSQAAGGYWVAIGVFLVAVELFFFLFFCRDRGPH